MRQFFLRYVVKLYYNFTEYAEAVMEKDLKLEVYASKTKVDNKLFFL